MAILSYETWQGRFGGSPDVIGRELWATAGVPIVGVLPPGFIPPMWNGHDAEWGGLLIGSGSWIEIAPTERSFPVIARLNIGTTIDQARSEMATLVTALAPTVRPEPVVSLVRVDSLQQTLFSRFRTNFVLIMGATALLLLLACANLATLLLAHGRSRERDAAIAAAIGASRQRLVGQALLTSIVICLAGSLVAVAAVLATSRGLMAILPPLIARYATAATDPRVLGIALSLAIVCAIAAGVVPSLRTARVDALQVLQRTPQSTRHSRLRGGSGLLTIETAIGVVLVLSSLLMLRSFDRLAGDDLGFRPEGLYTVTIIAQAPTPEAGLVLYEQALDALRDVPGVAAVGGVDSPVASAFAPMRGFSNDRNVRGGRFEVSGAYFDTIGTTFLAGRAFTDAEVRARTRVAILSRAAAQTLWPELRPDEIVGRPLILPEEPPFQVVGVVPDFKGSYGQQTVNPALFVPLGTGPSRFVAASVRVQPGAPIDLAAFRQRVTERIGPATVDVTPVTARLDLGLEDPQLRAILFTTLALAGLLLAATGLYAVAAFDMRQRQYEMGVRLSFGATARDIRRMVIAQTCRPVVAGVIVGFVLSYWATTILQQFLYQIDPRDPWVYAGVAVILVATGVLAAWLPAWRASRLDPSVVLRAQ